MRNKTVVIALVLLVVSLTSAYAGNSSRIGTAGAQELLIPIGSRGTAMGGAVMSTTQGVESMFWNPAGLASLEGTEAMFTHLPYIADIDVNFVGVATAIEDFGVIGAGAKVVSIGDIEQTTIAQPDGNGEVFSPSLTVLNLTYARILTANVSFGATAMFFNENIADAKANGMAFDVGFTYNPRWNGMSIGFAIKNYGPEAEFSGVGFYQNFNSRPVAPVSDKFDLPSSFNVGIGFDFLRDGPHFASIAGNFRSNNFQDDFIQGGMEYAYKDQYFLRAGYNFSDQESYLYGASLGAGLSYNLGETKISFEYSWTETETFDDNQYFTVKMNF